MIDDHPQWVIDLPDGRCAITMQTIVEYPEVARIVKGMPNYWQLDPVIDCYVGPFPDDLP
jgi:hypothetical protein